MLVFHTCQPYRFLPEEYRKTAPATATTGNFVISTGFWSSRHECTKTWISVEASPETVGKAKAMTVMTTSLRSVASDMVEPCVCECSLSVAIGDGVNVFFCEMRVKLMTGTIAIMAER